MIVISNYNYLDKKILGLFFSIAAICTIFMVISIAELSREGDFYKNYRQVNGLIKNVNDKQDIKIIRVGYMVDEKSLYKDFEVNNSELATLNIGDSIDVFYNKNNPKDARLSSKSLASIVIIICLLVLAVIVFATIGIMYYIRIRTNIRLINDNNTVEARFYRLEFKNSIIGNERINYVYCKAIIDGEKKIFKSIGFKNKPKPLNDKSIINVYIDNKNNYLVNVYEIFE